jgi:hypothetical protein
MASRAESGKEQHTDWGKALAIGAAAVVAFALLGGEF